MKEPGAHRSSTAREHGLLSILELMRELTASHDPHATATLLLLNLMGHFATPKAALWLVSSEASDLPMSLRSCGVSRQTAVTIGSICGTPAVRHALSATGPTEPAALSSVISEPDRRFIEEARIALLAPILVQNSLRGFIGLGSRIGGQTYSREEKQILEGSLGVVGVALENSSLYNNLMEKNRQLRQAARERQEFDQAKSEFLRNVNHELRTPLTVVAGYLDLLLSDQLDPACQTDFLLIVKEHSSKLTALLDKLLDFSQLATNSLEIRLREGDLAELLAGFHKERLPGIRQSLRQFTLRVEEPVLPSRFDPLRVTQVLNAIVDNAVKFTPRGSHITIRGSRFQENERLWTRVDIIDDGQGISAERIPVLLEAFRQGDGSTTRTVGGMGIGLPLAKSLVEEMGGSLTVKSQVGVGSVISLLLQAV